jgi:hypothetical protein
MGRVKRTGTGPPPATGESCATKPKATRETPELTASFTILQHPSVAYIGDCWSRPAIRSGIPGKDAPALNGKLRKGAGFPFAHCHQQSNAALLLEGRKAAPARQISAAAVLGPPVPGSIRPEWALTNAIASSAAAKSLPFRKSSCPCSLKNVGSVHSAANRSRGLPRECDCPGAGDQTQAIRCSRRFRHCASLEVGRHDLRRNDSGAYRDQR